MTTNEAWRRYLEAGNTVGRLTVARAEEIAKGLFASDEEERQGAWRDVEGFARFGMRMGEQLVEVARAEFARRIATRGTESFEKLLDQLGNLITSEPSQPGQAGESSKTTSATVSHPPPSEVVDATDAAPSKTKKRPKHKDAEHRTIASDTHSSGAKKGAKKRDKKQRKKEKGPTSPPLSTEAERPLSLAAPPGPEASF